MAKTVHSPPHNILYYTHFELLYIIIGHCEWLAQFTCLRIIDVYAVAGYLWYSWWWRCSFVLQYTLCESPATTGPRHTKGKPLWCGAFVGAPGTVCLRQNDNGQKWGEYQSPDTGAHTNTITINHKMYYIQKSSPRMHNIQLDVAFSMAKRPLNWIFSYRWQASNGKWARFVCLSTLLSWCIQNSKHWIYYLVV